MKASRITGLLAALLVVAGSAQAQFPTAVQSGVRVRVWLPEEYRQLDGPWRRQLLRGTVESVAGDTLHLSVPGSSAALAIPRASIKRLDISLGPPSRGASMAERAFAGAVGGAISTVILNETWPGGRYYHRTWRAAGAGAQWGAITGAIVGFVFPNERWRRARL
jgi:hypothetical protein